MGTGYGGGFLSASGGCLLNSIIPTIWSSCSRHSMLSSGMAESLGSSPCFLRWIFSLIARPTTGSNISLSNQSKMLDNFKSSNGKSAIPAVSPFANSRIHIGIMAGKSSTSRLRRVRVLPISFVDLDAIVAPSSYSSSILHGNSDSPAHNSSAATSGTFQVLLLITGFSAFRKNKNRRDGNSRSRFSLPRILSEATNVLHARLCANIFRSHRCFMSWP
mmetsp:Transcript_18324/g.28294  ORF Transcript_18324/g.28294 Transcript_18324/m.28294 type:complete len:218 (-) Transcript_18324:164-817(-)